MEKREDKKKRRNNWQNSTSIKKLVMYPALYITGKRNVIRISETLTSLTLNDVLGQQLILISCIMYPKFWYEKQLLENKAERKRMLVVIVLMMMPHSLQVAGIHEKKGKQAVTILTFASFHIPSMRKSGYR